MDDAIEYYQDEVSTLQLPDGNGNEPFVHQPSGKVCVERCTDRRDPSVFAVFGWV